MRDSRPDPSFVEALLAQDRDVSEGQYAAYRRELERRVAAEALRRRRRRRVVAALCLAAAAVAAVLALRLWPAGPPAETPSAAVRPEPVVLRPAAPRFVCAPALPFALEESADVIAIAAVGEPWTRQGQQFVRLDVERCLKGEPGGAFSCGVPAEATPAGAEHKGDRVLLYLQGSKKDGWSLVEIRPLNPQPAPVREGPGLAEIERFLDVRRAAASPDPRAEYGRCLAPARGGVDGPALSALCMKPDAASLEVLLREQARPPYGAANARAIAAVRAAAQALGGDARARVHEAWLKLLGAYAPPQQPAAGEREFIRAVIEALADAELSPAARQQLHALRKRPTPAWFREELGRLAGR